MFQEHKFSESLAGLELPHHPVVYADLRKAYSDPNRHYHDTKHVTECLVHLDNYRHLAERPFEIEIAIWFHDAVYETTKEDNEEQSAKWAQHFLTEHGADLATTQRVREMILATKTHEAGSPDAGLMLDIDLGILGTPSQVFESYDAAIRREYHWVSEVEYRTGRARILQGFLERNRIYQTQVFRDAFEAQARQNLAGKVSELVR